MRQRPKGAARIGVRVFTRRPNMKTKLHFSLKFKFISVITLSVVFTALALTAFFIYTQKNVLQASIEKRAKKIAETIADNSNFNIITPDKDYLNNLAENARKADEDVAYAVIYDINISALGQSHLNSVEISDFLFYNKPDISDAVLFGAKAGKANYYKLKNIDVYEVIVPVISYDQQKEIAGASLANNSIRDDDRGEIVGLIRVGVTLEDVNKKITSSSQTVLTITLIVVVLSILIANIFVKAIVTPIKELVDGTKKIASGDLSYRAPLTSNDELSDLAESFNSMAQDLKNYVDELNSEKQDLLKLKAMLEQRGKELEETLNKIQNIQEELVRSEKFATIGRLASSVAHELRNPLASLKNISYYFTRTGVFKDDKTKKMLEMLSADVARANKIITDLLDYSKAKKLNKLETYMDDFMEKAVANVPLPANIRLVKKFGKFKVMLDPDKMTQVIINIVSNAKDAMPNGGEITICERETPKYAEITIEDNGMGMSQETISHIFEPLFSTKLKGIGLGLSIVKEIVEAHFGKISAQSVEGLGTKFTITLPLG
ncbi:MAG: HAMP domain-containing protein [Endomicrobium sp.]|jgi:signal transduction histidine kinase|nr:HAMP domain-containing protein [Endomicrobium sp.]